MKTFGVLFPKRYVRQNFDYHREPFEIGAPIRFNADESWFAIG